MDTTYVGFYARFDTLAKKDGAALLGADNLIGDTFDIIFEVKDGRTIAWLQNRFNNNIGFLSTETTHKLQILHARNWLMKAILSFVAFTDRPDPGCYWGEVAIIAYEPEYRDVFERFAQGVGNRLMEGNRPEINLGEQGIKHILESNGSWIPSQMKPISKQPGTVIMKSHRTISEKIIEQGRQRNKGCYLISWLFILVLIVSAVFMLKACGVF